MRTSHPFGEMPKGLRGTITRFVWDGNVPLHEWQYNVEDRPKLFVNEKGDIELDAEEPIPTITSGKSEKLTTWVFEHGSFAPQAKIVGDKTYSVICDYLGTPVQAFNDQGENVWECELDIYGKVRSIEGSKTFIPFRYQGQYEDVETGLYYNRYRYYSSDTGGYISQDPIRLTAGMLNLYTYATDVNSEVDVFGLDCAKKILDDVGPIVGKKKTDVQKTLKDQGFSKQTAGNGGEVWTKAGSDGNTAAVRLDPAMSRNPSKGFADEVPHGHKEIVPTSSVSDGNYGQPRTSGSQSYNDAGNLSRNPRETHIPIVE
ncbi:RHS repeat-associated core domain-containing protein [uncultured Algibacter sp.]|uniref:RHS repeat domain-containing protein n=1 Tax=uncultured Algibacter sp. TaxID=298659 RepID=UPI003217C121